MNVQFDVEKLLLAHKSVRAELLAERAAGGFWAGQIGSSPVATAAAVSALVVSHHQDSDDLLRNAAEGDQDIAQLVQGDLSELLFESVHWLARRQNEDGGWGDCDGAESNVAATMLVQAAFRLTGIPAKYADLMARADDYVEARNGVAGLKQSIGGDKTYLTPILANCATADMISWRQVPTLPFEWLALPSRWRRDLPTLADTYMAPIVLAVGLAKFHNDPSRNPITRLGRQALRKRSLAQLALLQGADDSFLASPLVTAFVVTSLASMGLQDHRIVERGVEYLLSSVRADASWSVAASQSTINTSLALAGLSPVHGAASLHGSNIHEGDAISGHWQDTATPRDTLDDLRTGRISDEFVHRGVHLSPADEIELDKRCLEWLLKTQHVFPSPLTEAPAGGWGASDAAGAEPNAIATGAALSSLADFYERDGALQRGQIERAASAGVAWLIGMHNDDGGWATYGRGADSEIDPTVHAVRALATWRRLWTRPVSFGATRPPAESAKCGPAIDRAIQFLESQQREDGCFVPVWFGNQHQRDDENPVIGTSLVLTACAELGRLDSAMARARCRLVDRGAAHRRWLGAATSAGRLLRE